MEERKLEKRDEPLYSEYSLHHPDDHTALCSVSLSTWAGMGR
jgi:hypothetical protein